jgi:hypothetical protein
MEPSRGITHPTKSGLLWSRTVDLKRGHYAPVESGNCVMSLNFPEEGDYVKSHSPLMLLVDHDLLTCGVLRESYWRRNHHILLLQAGRFSRSPV